MFLEDELFDERSICEAIFKNSTEAIVISDHQGRIMHANPALLSLFQYGFYELITQPIHILLPEGMREKHVGHVEGYTQNPHKRSMGKGTVLYGRKKDGSTFPLSASLSPTAIGKTPLVVGLIIDLTELEGGRQQLSELNQELESLVQKRTEELAKSVAQLEKTLLELEKAQLETQAALKQEKELNELKSRFVSMASHEFRTPLSTILSSLNLLERYEERNEGIEKKGKHFLRIKNNVKHLNSILNDFLSLDKLQSGVIDIVLAEVCVKELIDNLLIDFESFLKQGQKIEIQHKGKETFKTDVNLIRNILLNLLTNASKYSDENTVITLNLNVGEELHLCVIDQGIGIPEEDQKHLFERFFRAHNAMNIPGTGLGLNIVKRYTELLGGELSFKSELGVGTEFCINIKQDE